jgi:hypothetical protein
LPAVSSLLTPIAELVGWVLQLPTPLLAAAAAVGLWMKFGGPISAAVTAFASSVRTATGSMAGFKAAVGGIASSLAGGLAFAGITVAIMAIAQAFQRSSQAAATATEAYQPVVDAIVASKGAWSDAAAAAQNNAILTSGAFKGLIEAGFGADQAVKILLGTQEEWIAVQSDGSDATRNLTKDTSAAVDGMIDANGAAGKLAQAQLEGAVAIDAQTGATQANSAATKEAADAQQKASEEAAKAAVEAAKTAAAQTGVKVALDSVKTAASEASTAVDFYVLSMQQAAGMNVTTDQAAKLLNDTMRGTAEAFKASSDANNLNKAALTTWNVAVLTSTEQGSSLYDALIKQQSGFAAVTTAAFSAIDPVTGVAGGMTAAAAAADTAYQAFITMATGAGLSGSEAEQLAGKLGIVQGVQLDPKTFDLIVQDQQADQALADAQAAEIAAKSFDITANPAPAVEQMDATAAGAPDATIVADANTASADAGLKTSANQKLPATVTASANTAVADSQLSALVSQARTITIQVEANISPAAVMINQLVALTRTATITVTANTSSFDQTMRDITNRSYSATVTVTANTSAATASIAAVPRSVAVPPPAAPALRGATQQSTQVATSNINYNVTLKGGITDPDGAARAIVQVLEGRARRSTTVIAR